MLRDDGWEHMRKPLTAAQIVARDKAAATRAANAAATAKRKAEQNRNLAEMSIEERVYRLTPKLINGKVIMADGRPVEIGFDPQTETLIAKFGRGEFWKVDRQLKPLERAPAKAVARAGFDKPRAPSLVDRWQAEKLQRRVNRGDIMLVAEVK